MNTRYAVLVAVGLLISSTGALAWSGKGNYEPSNDRDANEGFMFQTGDTSGGDGSRQVYFNGFATVQDQAVVYGAYSANVGMLESGLETTSTRPFAMLGVWKDCNIDEYIGSGENFYRYPVEMLPADSPCLVDLEFPTHNDGRWVYEFLPITWNNDTEGNLACCDINTYPDNKAVVWVDRGYPEAVTAPTCGPAGALPVTTQAPPHFNSRTGAMISYVDCQLEYAGTDALYEIEQLTGVDGIAFDDVPRGHEGESSSVLNQEIPVGESEDESYVYAFDCSSPPEETVVNDPLYHEDSPLRQDPTVRDAIDTVSVSGVPGVVIWNTTDADGILLHDHVNPTPRAPEVNQGGSFWGTVNTTHRESTTCDESEAGLQDPAEERDSENNDGTLGDLDDSLILTERDGYGQPFNGRTRPDTMLVSAQWPEDYTQPGENDVVGIANEVLNRHGDFAGGLSFRQFWYGQSSFSNDVLVTRSATPAPASVYTYYARVSGDAISNYGLQLPGQIGAYGSEACAATSGDGLPRFDCVRQNWWLDSAGEEVKNEGALNMCERQCDPRAFVGDEYNLRDIDCYDNSIGALRDMGLTVPALLSKGC